MFGIVKYSVNSRIYIEFFANSLAVCAFHVFHKITHVSNYLFRDYDVASDCVLL